MQIDAGRAVRRPSLFAVEPETFGTLIGLPDTPAAGAALVGALAERLPISPMLALPAGSRRPCQVWFSSEQRCFDQFPDIYRWSGDAQRTLPATASQRFLAAPASRHAGDQSADSVNFGSSRKSPAGRLVSIMKRH